MIQAIRRARFSLTSFLLTLVLTLGGLGAIGGVAAVAQPGHAPQLNPPPSADTEAPQDTTRSSSPPGEQAPQAQNAPSANGTPRDARLVRLYVTVLDHDGQVVPDLGPQNFRVVEERVEQKLSFAKLEDAPASVGLVIDASGSMRDKFKWVAAGALTFVKAGNPKNQVFVADFNDHFYIDQDFTSDVDSIERTLQTINSTGSTALYDALGYSLIQLGKGASDKKVLLVITDGMDDASRLQLGGAIHEARLSGALIYAIGLLSDTDKIEAKRARKALEEISEASGGLAYFPKSLADTDAICAQAARDIRNLYTLGYYPTNMALGGGYRSVEVKVIPPPGRRKLSVRARSGYYGPEEPSDSGGN